MISRRNYITITILMFSLLLLCLSINHLKDGLNDYAVNQYTETAENYPSKVNIYVPTGFVTDGSQNPEAGDDGETAVVPRNLVVCIGNPNKTCMKAAAEWVVYTKRNYAAYSTMSAYRSAGQTGEPPEMLVIDPGYVDWRAQATIDFLNQRLADGTSVVLCGMPAVSVIQESPQVRELLGIQSVAAEEITVDGFYLREGFLLGGTTFYLEKTGTDAEEPLAGSSAFPGERTFPWYLPASGTKVYMRGVLEDDAVEAEDTPIVLWRNSRGNAYVFAVNGDFMQGEAAIGLLSAMSAEMHAYELYPVVNAQNIILTGYPSLANENTEEMQRLYSRPIEQVHQELMWPGISQLLKKYNYRATCMLAPQYDYSDNGLPDDDLLKSYLKIFAENSAETGLYGLSVSPLSLQEKLETDGRFFKDAIGGYDIVSFYAGNLRVGQIAEALNTDILSSTRTVVRDCNETRTSPVEFFSDSVTEQSVLNDGMHYTHQSDFLVRSMETALGYLSMSFDLSQVAYPSDGETTWEKMSDVMASTVSTYGQQYSGFDGTTTAECDARIRQFLAMDYSEIRTGNQIKIKVHGTTGSVWFILRTHNEVILNVDGGSWKELEEGAYLIEMAGENASAILTLGPADDRHFR